MRLEGEIYDQYKAEIADLYREWLEEDPVPGLIYFGILGEGEEGEELQAVASVKNYMGSWYLRGCVVKPEYRGRGLQQEITRELLEFLEGRTELARVSVYPENIYSKRNIEAVGFEFERRKKLDGGREVLVYRKALSRGQNGEE